MRRRIKWAAAAKQLPVNSWQVCGDQGTLSVVASRPNHRSTWSTLATVSRREPAELQNDKVTWDGGRRDAWG